MYAFKTVDVCAEVGYVFKYRCVLNEPTECKP